MYPIDFRRHVLSIKTSEKLSFADAAKRFSIGKATLVRWSNRLEPILKRNAPGRKIDMTALKKDVETYPDAYQYERAQRLGVSQNGICLALKRLGVTYKKNPKTPQSGSRKTFCVL